MTPALKLTYFNIHGLGSRIRLACRVGHLPLVDYRFADRDEFMALKPSLTSGQVPLLEVTEEGKPTVQLSQSSAILRYVCTLAGLHPTDLLKAAAVDAALALEADAFAAFRAVRYRDRSGLSHLSAEDAATAAEKIGTVVIPGFLAHLEKLLARSTTGWVADTPQPSAADFAWGAQLHQARGTGDISAATLARDKLPLVNAFLDKFLDVPEVKAYYDEFPV